MGKTLTAIATILTMLVVFVGVGVGGYIWWSSRSATHIVAKEQKQVGTATVAEGQAKLSADATKIIVSGEAHQKLDIQLHEANSNALAQAFAKIPDANAAIDPNIIDAANLELCRYPVNAADPRCVGLRAGDTSFIPNSNPVGGITQ